MKNQLPAILTALLISALTQNIFAQWIPVYQDANTEFRDAAFPTDNIGYVAATDTGGAVLLRTNDGGLTWDKRYINGWSFIDKVAMTDSLTGYLIKGGAPVQLLKTTDGFATYTMHNLDSSFVVQSLELVNDSTGFYLNNATRLRKFKNNGASYFHVFDTLFDGQNLQFVNPTTGYLDNGSKLLKTTDGGSSWNFANNNLGFYCVVFKFVDSLNGYFHDGSMIYKTSDGGLTFPQQYNFPDPTTFTVNGNFCMVANAYGDVAYTTDNAQTWQTETTGINWVATESYILKNSPDGSLYLFSQFCGEIRKRQPVIAGVNEYADEKSISVYPNPASDMVTFSSNGFELSGAKIRIIDVTGKLVFSQISDNYFSATVEIPDLISDGFYLLEIENPKQRVNKRLLIQRNN